MKKQLLLMISALTLSSGLMANETMEHKESDYYAVVKGMYIVGDDVEHGDVTLSGDSGYGFGIDLGYRLPEGFALEYDFSYTTADVHEGEEVASAEYITHALDIVYAYEATSQLNVFVKVGYEYEEETIDDYGIDASDDGAVFGLGCEYVLNHTYNLVLEYEHSTIEGPRGDSLNFGVMYNF